MKTFILLLLTSLFVFFTKTGNSQCDYFFSSFEETIILNGDPTSTPLNSISSCGEYLMSYEIAFNSTGPAINDVITIHLPVGVTYTSLSATNGTVTGISGTTDVTFTLSGWNSANVFEIEFVCASPGCSATPTAGITQISGADACSTVNTSSSITLGNPVLDVQNMGSGTVVKNIGDVDELIFKISNDNGNGAVISQVSCDFQLNSNVSSLINTGSSWNQYYLSTSPVGGTGTNIYTYTLPGGVTPVTLPSGGTININSAEWLNLLGHSYLADHEEIYLHIPYKVVSCDNSSDGIFDFAVLCGSTPCQQQTEHSSISTSLSIPIVNESFVGTDNHVGSPNATFCSAAGGQNMQLDWVMHNAPAGASGGPAGYGRMTDLELVLLVNNTFGEIDPASFSISSSTGSLAVPSSAVYTDPAPFLVNAALNQQGTIYKIKLNQIPVSANNWAPLGTSSLADLDGDGFIDDMVESGILNIHVDYTYYDDSCGLSSTSSQYYSMAILEWNYDDACGNPVNVSAYDGEFHYAVAASQYGYTATGEGAELTLPPDVLAGTDFISELCFAPYSEGYSTGFGFDCPDGFHRVIYNIPDGYYVRTTGLTPSSTNTGWYELPAIIATSKSGTLNATASITPILTEYCNPSGEGRIVEIRFGLIPWDNLAFNRPYTYEIPCFTIPMYLFCDSTALMCDSLPNNFGFDNFDFKLEFVCDETCESCSAYIVGAGASTFHHCLGLCDSYFETDPNPVFKRDIAGHNNTPTGLFDCSDLAQPSNLNINTEPTINLKAAYPGDPILLQVSGKFVGSPAASFPSLTGSSFDNMYLQIRYEDLPANQRKEARIFDLDDQYSGDGITITEEANPSNQYFIPVSDIVMTDFVNLGLVHLNLNFSPGALAWMNNTNAHYLIESNLHLRVRMEPTSAAHHYFFGYGPHPVTSLRFEYKGTELVSGQIDGSCDDYGANFKILQPDARASQGSFTTPWNSTCDLLELNLRFYNDGALYFTGNDFPNEFRPYAELGSDLTVTVPAGYDYVGAYWQQDKKQYSSTAIGTNYFGTQPQFLTLPVSGETVTTTVNGTQIDFHGLDPASNCWPLKDLEFMSASQFLVVKLQPTCSAPTTGQVFVSGDYTLSVQQPSPAYQLEVPFDYDFPLNHYNPAIDIINPSITINATSGNAEFDFSICNQSVPNSPVSATANQPWVAFENSVINGLDLTTAALTIQPSGTPVNFTTYTDGIGNQGILANLSTLAINACVNLQFSVDVNANGCVEGTDPELDFLHVLAGNSCDGTILTTPEQICQSEITDFSFKRYPSDLEVLLPGNAYPDSVELCNDTLVYNFVLNSYEIGSVSDNRFWIDLPNGIDLLDATFSNTAGTPATITVTTFDGTTYGPGSNMNGWDLLPHLGLTLLPGINTSPENQIPVTIRLLTSCDYNLSDEVVFYTNAINACSLPTTTFDLHHTPGILSSTSANDLVLSSNITFSDSDSVIDCNNTATITLTIQNNSANTSITGLDLVAEIPSYPMTVGTGGGTLTGNQITWHFAAGSIPGGSTTTVSYTLSMADSSYCISDIPLSASIGFSQDIDCASAGGSCEVLLNTEPIEYEIDACCECSLVLNMTSEPVYCKASPGSATVSVSGAVGNVTYLWSNGQTTATATNLFQGIYVVTVTDENGCTETDSVTVGAVNSPLTITATPDQNPICEGESVSIALGGATSYTVSSGIYGTTSSGAPVIVSPTGTTTYTVNGSDQFGCFGTTTVTIEVDSLIAPLFDSAGSYCYGDSIPALPTTSLNGVSGTWSPAINNTATTTYIFTPSAGQCAATATLAITVNSPVTPTFNPVGPYCAGATIPALPTTSSNNIDGSWSPAINNTATTTYTFTPDEDECAVSDTLTITIIPNVEPIFKKIKTVYCYGETIPALPTTSVNGISGTWSPALNNTVTTEYTFTSTSTPCVTPYTLTITINPIVTPTFTQMGPYCVGSTPGSLPLTSDNGVSGTWSPASISTTTAGTTTYTFTPTAGQCATAVTMNITVNPNPVPTISFDGNLTLCSGSSVWLISSSPTNNTWSTGSTNSSINVTTAGSYTVTVNNGNGCSATSAPVVVTVNAAPSAPTITASGPLTFCSGGSVTLTSNAASGNLWSTGATTQSITVSTSGTYTVTRTVNGCTSPASAGVTVTVNPIPSAPTITAGGSLTFCSGGSVTLTSNAASGNLWSTGATTQSITVNSSGTYTVTRTVNGCTSPASASVTVTVTTPVISGPTFSACVGGAAVQLTGTPAGGSWTSTASSIASVNASGLVTPSSSNSGNVIITYTVGSCSTTHSFAVNPVPSISGTFNACVGGNTSQLTGTPTGGTWWSQNGNTAATVNASGLVTTSSTTYGSTNIYYSVNGCTTSVNFIINPLPTISAPATSACLGGSAVQFSGSPSGGTWSSTASSIASVSSTGLVTPSASNSGTVNITYTLATGCQKTQSFTVNPLPFAPSINNGATTVQICTGDYATLSSTPYTSNILWTPGSATTPSIVVPAPASTTNYTVTYTHPATGCKSSATVAVSKKNCFKPVGCTLAANFNSGVSGCNWTFSSSSTFSSATIASPGTGYTFSWTILNASTGALVTTGSGFSFAYNGFPAPGTYTVCLTVTSNKFSPLCQDQICKNISVTCGSAIVLSTNSTGLRTKFEVKGEENEVVQNDMDYLWSFGDGTFSTEEKPEHTYAKPGSYEVCLRTGLGDLTNAPVSACRTIHVSGDETDAGIVPILSVNPNPTNGQTTILLDGAENRTVEIKLYTMLGEEVTTLFARACCNETMIRLIWNSEIVPSGVYLIKAQVDSKTIVEKVVVGTH